MRSLVAAACLLTAVAAEARSPMPEDFLKGQIIVSDKPIPNRWTSVPAYVSKVKAMNRPTLWYDKKTGKVTVEFAAFFTMPVNDVQVELVIYDVTNGAKDRKATTENFIGRGERVLFNSVVFDKQDFEMNRKYLMVIESRRTALASGAFILRGEGEKYSGKVTFSDDETRVK